MVSQAVTEQEAHPDYFCEHGVFGFEPCQDCETNFNAKLFECLMSVQGHEVVNGEGWATPDSGGEEFWCMYCLTEWRCVYY